MSARSSERPNFYRLSDVRDARPKVAEIGCRLRYGPTPSYGMGCRPIPKPVFHAASGEIADQFADASPTAQRLDSHAGKASLETNRAGPLRPRRMPLDHGQLWTLQTALSLSKRETPVA